MLQLLIICFSCFAAFWDLSSFSYAKKWNKFSFSYNSWGSLLHLQCSTVVALAGFFVSLNMNFPMLFSDFLRCAFPEYTIKLLVVCFFFYFWRPCIESICPFVDCHITANNCNNPGFKPLKYGEIYLPCTGSTAVEHKAFGKCRPCKGMHVNWLHFFESQTAPPILANS